ncbi:MAG: hypothetical protein LBD42_04780 [Desulfovibrio sp.]|jgi:tetratricopeptide (TPR) repeat protein|nr:hypothetical protein [Desulfovibrio sp.]
MMMPLRAAWSLYLSAVIGVSLLMAATLFLVMSYSAGENVPHERYYRAVFVLQNLGGSSANEREDIPRRIPYADATENLLHHPDKIFVLGHVAEELAQVRREVPKAALFEAYARLDLGDRRNAARLLTSYVIENDYNGGHYALLSRILHELGDYPSLLLICREWSERDPSCRADRARFTWISLHNSEQYGQAENFVLAEENCLGWQAPVYAAKSIWDAGKEHESGRLIENAIKRYTESRQHILMLWEQIRNKEWL